MHQNRWRLRLRPRTHWGSLQSSPRPPSWIQGVLLLRGGEGGEDSCKNGSDERNCTFPPGPPGEGRGGESRGGGLPRLEITSGYALAYTYFAARCSSPVDDWVQVRWSQRSLVAAAEWSHGHKGTVPVRYSPGTWTCHLPKTWL